MLFHVLLPLQVKRVKFEDALTSPADDVLL